jgi:hypothetical protein
MQVLFLAGNHDNHNNGLASMLPPILNHEIIFFSFFLSSLKSGTNYGVEYSPAMKSASEIACPDF